MAEEAVAMGAVAEPAMEETKSLLATIFGQLLTIVRQIIDAVLKVTRQVINFASQHPLALTLLVANIMIWVS